MRVVVEVRTLQSRATTLTDEQSSPLIRNRASIAAVNVVVQQHAPTPTQIPTPTVSSIPGNSVCLARIHAAATRVWDDVGMGRYGMAWQDKTRLRMGCAHARQIGAGEHCTHRTHYLIH